MKYYIIIVLMLITCLVNAQVVDFVGNVIVDNVEENYNKAGVHIINNRTKELYTTHSDGTFKMKVQVNDELVFKSDFTQTRIIKISESILNKGFINVHLDIAVIQLAEANLNPLKPNLKDNINTDRTAAEKLQDEVNYVSPEFRQKMLLEHEDAAARRAIAQTGGVNLMGFGTAIFGVKSKTKPKVKSNFEIAEAIKKYFTIDYFTNDLRIEEYQVNQFLSFCFKESSVIKTLFEKGRIEEVILLFEELALEFNRKMKT